MYQLFRFSILYFIYWDLKDNSSVKQVNLQVSCVHPLKRHLPQRHQAPGNLAIMAFKAKTYEPFSSRIFCLILSLESSSCAILAAPSIWSEANPTSPTSALDTTGLLETLQGAFYNLVIFLQGTWTDFWGNGLHNEHWCVECRLRFCWADVGPGWCEWRCNQSPWMSATHHNTCCV